jgi:hypothetical protein
MLGAYPRIKQKILDEPWRTLLVLISYSGYHVIIPTQLEVWTLHLFSIVKKWLLISEICEGGSPEEELVESLSL